MYEVWWQVLNKNGTINSEDILVKCETLEEAIKVAGEGDVIRLYDGDSYTEWDYEGNEI